METSEIGALIHGFNIAAISVVAVFAVCGVFVIFGKKFGMNFFSKKLFFPAFCVAALAAFVVEATLLNLPYYLKFFSGPYISTTDVPPDNPNIIRTTDGTLAEITVEKNESGGTTGGIKFKNLDRMVSSIFVDIEYINVEVANMRVKWTHDSLAYHEYTKKLYKRLPHENYTPFQFGEKVAELTVTFSAPGSDESSVSIRSVALNKPIPMYFSGLRLLVVSFLLFALFTLFSKKLRAKASYYLFECKFNPASRKQNLLYAFSALVLILFSWVCINTTVFSRSVLESMPVHQLYYKYLVDAIIDGRTWIDYGTPEKLLEWERPYSFEWRVKHGYKVNVDWMWEWDWYKGKYYCYFGVVPAALLHVPYKLITGSYLSVHSSLFLLASAAVVLLALFWRYCVRRYMPESRFAFYWLSFLALFFASGFYSVLAFTRHYSIVQAAGFVLAVAGAYLLLKSVENEKINRVKLFFACLCLALIVGCRPNMIAISLLVPIILWKRRSWKLLLFVAIPYIIVAIPLCWYNYARFDSIFKFGGGNLAGASWVALSSMGKIIVSFMAAVFYLIHPNQYSLYFPYVETFSRTETVITGLLHKGGESTVGLINFPIALCLFYYLKNLIGKGKQKNKLMDRPEGYHTSLAFLAVAAASMGFVVYALPSASVRYILDFMVFFIFPSLFCAYYWINDQKSALPHTFRLKTIYVLLAVSIFVGLCLFVSGGLNYLDFRNSTLYRYLEYSLGFSTKV